MVFSCARKSGPVKTTNSVWQLPGSAFALVLLVGCASAGEKHTAVTRITGRVVHQPTGRAESGMSVEIADIKSRFSLFGISGPIPLGITTTNRNGYFEIVVHGTFRSGQIGIRFRETSNMEAMKQGFRVVDVTATPLTSRRSE